MIVIIIQKEAGVVQHSELLRPYVSCLNASAFQILVTLTLFLLGVKFPSKYPNMVFVLNIYRG